MKRDYKLYLNDILESIKQIEEYMQNISEEEFKKDKKLQDAVIRRLEIIGEASRNIPRALKEKNKHIPWFDMSQFRDFIVHSYFETNIKRIWKASTKDIQKIKELFKHISLV
ncbi:DUF86 domain-containing protein [Candidatus Pacearchaeota archaeon CG10_big_fil_rev_8_21_14_0_10_31_9]|nr:MAG: hypothetical protein AUJ62_01210 [Candidatus Pacearchaeota archaeon CG1_02_32_21]PIN91660.1 MAG: DUF86 domain-containing protein [Candidatus Pacearchaeota archaeon CG10_big_fil_rev_8_21_14_0_10_31_9]PIZ83889.1 MAG: DUF86 domain-containing protein [Candidatus Pacearchaeota archaeon CG_4_10_14_0_2_um_filter_05_32_18]